MTNSTPGTTRRMAYRCKLKPTRAQRAQLARIAGARRFAYNWALAWRQTYYQVTKTGMPPADLSTLLTAIKRQPETVWLADIDSQLLQQALADVQRAFGNFFAHRARYPRFARKKDARQRFRIPQRVRLMGDDLDGYHVTIPKIGLVRVVVSRPVLGTITSGTFSTDGSGDWFVSLAVEQVVADLPRTSPPPANPVGVDLGLKDLAVLSTGERVPAPRHYRHAERRLAHAQRHLSRCQRGSANRRKAKRLLARAHRRVANQRREVQHQLTHHLTLVGNPICIEDLHVAGLAKTKLAKSVYDAGWGEIRRQLTYKAAWAGIPLAVVGAFYPSSQIHHACGYRYRDLALSERVWTCPGCGARVERDPNAALNIRDEGVRLLVAAGAAETQNACGAHVRLASGEQ